MRTPGSAGELSAGAVADVVLMDLNTLPFIPLNDVSRQLVYCEPARSVRTVIIGGDVVVSDGRCTTIDEDAVLRDIADLAPDIESFIADCATGGPRLAPLRPLRPGVPRPPHPLHRHLPP